MSPLSHANALLRHLTMRQMRMVLAIDEHKSVLKASRELNVAQPALSRSLSDLESVLDLQLFNRSPRGMAPTAFGESLIRRLKTIIGELHDAEEELGALRAGTYGHVSIGCIPLLSAGILPRLLAGVIRTRPGLTLSVTDGGGVDILLKLLRDRKLDMVLCMRPKPNDHDNDFNFEPLFTDSMMLVAGRKHPAALARRPSIRNIDLEPIVLPSQGSMYRQRIDETFASFNRPPPTATMEASSPMLRMPMASSRAAALGPMPLMRRAGSGQMRAGISACVSTVRPSGFSSSEHNFESSLLGVTPIEQVRPVASWTRDLIACAMTRTPACGLPGTASCAPGTSVRSK